MISALKSVVAAPLFLALAWMEPDLHAQQAQIELDDPQTGIHAASEILIDGDTNDWLGHFGIIATESELLIHFESHDPAQTIQAADFTTRIRIDADANSGTGHRMITAPIRSSTATTLGVELMIECSPNQGFGSLRGGVAAKAFAPKGIETDIGHAGAGFHFLPTYNAPSYEVRIDRDTTGVPALRNAGPILVEIDALDAAGNILSTQRFSGTLPEYAPSLPELDAIPASDENAIRIMSTNVLRSSPLQDPAPFTRIINALAPDIILSQEWFGTPESQVAQWYENHIGDDWNHAYINASAGVAVSTPHTIEQTWTINNSNTRAIFALVRAGERELICVSIHLKCCGGAGSSEDGRRILEATQINARLDEIRALHPQASVVVAGDYNLVGTRAPLEILADDASIDGSDLVAANTIRLDDRVAATWTNPNSSFSPGRLDWLIYDASQWDAPQAFTLDTLYLDPSVLDEAGLLIEDTGSSDHLPLIVDLVPQED